VVLVYEVILVSRVCAEDSVGNLGGGLRVAMHCSAGTCFNADRQHGGREACWWTAQDDLGEAIRSCWSWAE